MRSCLVVGPTDQRRYDTDCQDQGARMQGPRPLALRREATAHHVPPGASPLCAYETALPIPVVSISSACARALTKLERRRGAPADRRKSARAARCSGAVVPGPPARTRTVRSMVLICGTQTCCLCHRRTVCWTIQSTTSVIRQAKSSAVPCTRGAAEILRLRTAGCAVAAQQRHNSQAQQRGFNTSMANHRRMYGQHAHTLSMYCRNQIRRVGIARAARRRR